MYIKSYSSCIFICHFLESVKQILLSGVWWPTRFLNEEIFLLKKKEWKRKEKTHKLISDGEFDLSWSETGEKKKNLIFFSSKSLIKIMVSVISVTM